MSYIRGRQQEQKQQYAHFVSVCRYFFTPFLYIFREVFHHEKTFLTNTKDKRAHVFGVRKNRKGKTMTKREKNLTVTFVVIIFLLLLLMRCTGTNKFSLIKDENSVGIGTMEKKDKVTGKLSDNMMNMTINPRPIFYQDSMTGNIGFENGPLNSHPQKVVIILSDETVIYESDAVMVGDGIYEVSLNKSLPKGKYEATAYISSINEETGKVIGTGGVAMAIEII